jgi:hypothetical protein
LFYGVAKGVEVVIDFEFTLLFITATTGRTKGAPLLILPFADRLMLRGA